jgi:hypothetical protein
MRRNLEEKVLQVLAQAEAAIDLSSGRDILTFICSGGPY